MRRLNLLSLPLAVFLLIFICACQAGGGYTTASTVGQPLPPAQSAPQKLAVKQAHKASVPAVEEGSNTLAEEAAYQMQPVKVALLLPLSGPHAQLGQAMLRSAQMAVFEIGADQFTLLPRDTKGTAAGARQAAQAVLSDGAQIILGPVFGEAAKAVAPVAQRYNVNVISFSTDWHVAGGNVFVMGFLPFDQVERVVTYAQSQGLPRIAVMAPETGYGRTVASAFRSYAGQQSYLSRQVQYFTPGSGEVQSAASALTGATEDNPMPETIPFDAVLIAAGGEDAVSASAFLTQYGAGPEKIQRLGTGLWDDRTLARDRALSGAWFAAPQPDLRRKFERRFMDVYGYQPTRLSTLAYDATALAAVLAQRGTQGYVYNASGGGFFSHAAIMNPNGFAGIDGIFRFRNDGTAERGLAVLEMQNGRIRVINPAPTTFQRAGAL